ncbi:hypothetical protein KDW49_27230 [Burkholderia dolosa]|uniref:hypothetical protein n=1 Tax=Burkholderia TaxID=32008 RepID=UPI000F5AB307|nr:MULTISPECIES: hypothetical protein [Burkholderia]MBR8304406.1 hypothetical protein [Burkholderia dolosa]RQR28049.1 hypothetical protein DIE23_25085 [Burkholderia sp. Bp9143]
MRWHVYQTSYIDWAWSALKSVDETRALLAQGAPESFDDLSQHPVEEFDAAFSDAQILAQQNGWEGDYRQGPVVFWLPDPNVNAFVYGFFWKQDNNGTCFTVSPVALPWLEDA